MRLTPGVRLGPYEILSPVGAGGMGEVYRAVDQRLGREVAIKVLGEELVGSHDAARRFEREARAVAALSHPNILSIFEFDIEANTPIVVTELLQGTTLRRRRDSRVPWRRAAEIAACVADGLAAAHACRIIHRDLKPENIFITTDGRVKILDFGIAHIMEATAPPVVSPSDSTPAAPSIRAIGTIGYAAPEQLTGKAPTPPTDIFSLGVILYEIISGKHPFRAKSSAETIAAVMNEDPPPLTQTDAQIPVAIDRIVRHCLEKNAEQRFQSAHDLAYQLREVVREFEQRPATMVRPVRRWAFLGAGALAATVALPIILYRAGSSTASVRAPIASLAILPLANATHDQNLDYVTDGITDSLINELSALPNLRVTARPTVFEYKGKAINPAQVGKQLGVAALATGRMDVHGTNVVIEADLIDASTGSQLWGNTYRRARDDMSTLPGDIARQIAGELRLQLTAPQEARMRRAPTTSEAAFDLYLRGLHSLNQSTKDGWADAIAYFQKAVEADPDYARAWAALAESYTRYSRYSDPHLMRSKAREALRRALQLDPDLAEALVSSGLLHLWDEWNLNAAEKDFSRAIQLNPSLAIAHEYYCSALRYEARFDEAIRQARIAKQLDPLSRGNSAGLASTLLFAGQTRSAIAELMTLIQTARDFDSAHYLLGYAYEQEGRPGEACAEYVKSDELAHEDPKEVAARGEACTKSGLAGYYRQELRFMLNDATMKEPFMIATLYLALGDKQHAYSYLEKAYEDHSANMLLLKSDPVFASIRNEPRFKDLMKRVGFDTNRSDELLTTQHHQRGNTPIVQPDVEISHSGETEEQTGRPRTP